MKTALTIAGRDSGGVMLALGKGHGLPVHMWNINRSS